jgi:transposase
MASIIKRTRGNTIYYVFQESYRVKRNRDDRGKAPGSGKSKVCTRSVYLGTAEKILECFRKIKEPICVRTRQFGLLAAAYQTAREIGLQEVLARHLPGDKCGVPFWIYFFVSILNRLHCATSKNKMSEWLDKTILPELLDFDASKLTSKNFWYAADNVLSEKGVRAAKGDHCLSDDPFVGLGEDAFTRIEEELFSNIDELMGLSPETICYDTTNFYTYIEEPKRSLLANTCHSKDYRNHLRHVGLLMAVERQHGLPLVSRVYRANRHDSRVFSAILADLVVTVKRLCHTNSELVIVLDKGNNSTDNFKAMSGQISWVGSLVPSNHKELIEVDLCDYQGVWNGLPYYRCQKEIMGMECAVVMTFNSSTRRKQEHTLERRIAKLEMEIRDKWLSYKKGPTALPRGIATIIQKSDYGTCLDPSVEQGELCIKRNSDEIEARKRRFGKQILFSNMLRAETGYLIDTYHEKKVIEDDFQLLKDPAIIRFRPIRHWTDTKIRAYAFCCVVAMTLMRVMQWKADQAGYKMSPTLLKDELSDIEEAIMIYSTTDAGRKITELSSVQEKLWKVFTMNEIEKKLALH